MSAIDVSWVVWVELLWKLQFLNLLDVLSPWYYWKGVHGNTESWLVFCVVLTTFYTCTVWHLCFLFSGCLFFFQPLFLKECKPAVFQPDFTSVLCNICYSKWDWTIDLYKMDSSCCYITCHIFLHNLISYSLTVPARSHMFLVGL